MYHFENMVYVHMFEFSTNGLTKMRAFVSIIIQFRVVFNNCVNFLISNSLGPELGAMMSDIVVVVLVKNTDLQIVMLLHQICSRVAEWRKQFIRPERLQIQMVMGIV